MNSQYLILNSAALVRPSAAIANKHRTANKDAATKMLLALRARTASIGQPAYECAII